MKITRKDVKLFIDERLDRHDTFLCEKYVADLYPEMYQIFDYVIITDLFPNDMRMLNLLTGLGQ